MSVIQDNLLKYIRLNDLKCVEYYIDGRKPSQFLSPGVVTRLKLALTEVTSHLLKQNSQLPTKF